MDARDRLRRYIEQRKELGESEFVLDELPVDELMRMIGMRGAARSSKSQASDAHEQSPRERHASNVDAKSNKADANANDQAVDARAENSHDEIPFAYSGDAPANVRADSAPPESTQPRTDQPPVPEPRFDANATTDWRKALAGLSPGSQSPTRNARKDAPTAANEPGERAASVGDVPVSDQATKRESTSASAPSSSVRAATPATPGVPLAPWLSALAIPAGLVAGNAHDARIQNSTDQMHSIESVADAIRICQACSLYATAINPVPGEGNPNADFVCVGEAPGQNEDESGRPFYGAAGQLLTRILGAIQLPREEVFICNVLKHRPPGNRNPLPDEVSACSPFLLRQLDLVKPRVILALGTFAAQTLLETTSSISKLRGQIHRFRGIPLIVTYHPAALLRNEAWKRPTWDDVKLARRILDASRAANPSA